MINISKLQDIERLLINKKHVINETKLEVEALEKYLVSNINTSRIDFVLELIKKGSDSKKNHEIILGLLDYPEIQIKGLNIDSMNCLEVYYTHKGEDYKLTLITSVIKTHSNLSYLNYGKHYINHSSGKCIWESFDIDDIKEFLNGGENDDISS